MIRRATALVLIVAGAALLAPSWRWARYVDPIGADTGETRIAGLTGLAIALALIAAGVVLAVARPRRP